jgi:hypothetical protein
MQLTAVRNLLAVAPDALGCADRNAFSLSLLWAQSVALNSSTDPASETYRRALIAELSRIAWIVDAAATVGYASEGGTTSPGVVVRKILDPYIGAGDDSGLGSLLDAIGRETVTPELGDFLTTWWAQQRTDLSAMAFAIGRLSRATEGLTATILFYAYDLHVARWQSFFLVSPQRSFNVTALPVSLTLNRDLWRQIEGTLAAKLGSAAAEFIRHLNIDL